MTDNNMITSSKVSGSIRIKDVIIIVLVTAIICIVCVTKFILSLDNLTAKNTPVSSYVKRDIESKPVIDVSIVNSKLKEMGELTTAEMVYDGLLRYDQGNIPLLTKHGFLMSYSAGVRAGIDFSKVTLKVHDDVVVVRIPKSEIQVLTVDPESISFYDESHALFEGDGKDHLKTALISAEADAIEKLDKQMILDRADKQAEEMICSLLEEVVDRSSIEVVR